MEILKGIGVTPGYAIGEAYVFEREDVLVRGRFVGADEIEKEVERFEAAAAKVTQDIERMRDRVKGDLGENVSGIFESYRWIIADPVFRDDVIRRIRSNRFTAEYAVDRSFKRLTRKLAVLQNPYMRQRVGDIDDLERIFLAALTGERTVSLSQLDRPVVIVGHDLTASQLAAIDRRKVLGIVTDVGGRTSHTAIMARDYGIPAVVGLETAGLDVSAGDAIIVDGTRGLVIIDPDDLTIARYRALEQEFVGFGIELAKQSRGRVVTRDGVQVSVMANMEFPEEVDAVLENGADGVGLFRTEFLYLAADRIPTEDEHASVYTSIARKLDGKPLVIRTFDLGADKLTTADAKEFIHERNPALGLRGVRLYRARPEVFRSQVSAVYRSSAAGAVELMIPMVNSVEDVRWVAERCREVRDDLSRHGVPFNPDMPVGVMMETPAAVMAAEAIAREVGFFSIGTNDLIQYTLAIDRSNERVAQEFDALNPSVLRMVERVIKVAAQQGIPCAMCGEMAGDTGLVALLVGMGLRAFSVSPGSVPAIKAVLNSLNVGQAQALAAAVMSLSAVSEIRREVERANRELIPEALRRGRTGA